MDFLLEIPAGTPVGESQVVLSAPAPKLIQLTSFSLGAQPGVGAATAGAGNGRGVPLMLEAVKNVNRDTPMLIAMAAAGQHFDMLTLHVRPKGTSADTITYTLNTAFIVSLTTRGGTGQQELQETLELAVGTLSAQIPT